MPAAIAKRVELFDIAKLEAGLRFDPGTQPNLEGSMRQRIEGAEGKAGTRRPAPAISGKQNRRLLGLDRHNGGGKPDLYRSNRRHHAELVIAC
jgi:hypothetical protein